MSEDTGGFFIQLVTAVGLIVLFTGPGFALLLYGLFNKKKTSSSRSWPSTTGKITAATINRQPTTGDAGHSYRPAVTYTYRVKQQPYTGRRIAFGTIEFESEAEAEEVLGNLPIGVDVPVYYNPQRPRESTLVPGKSGNAGNVIFLSIILLLGGSVMAALFISGVL